MKKLIAAILTMSVLALVACQGQPDEITEADIEYHNVGNGLPYTYEIMEIDYQTKEAWGKPLDKISEGNQGIYLYLDEVDFDLEPGDRITVVWGEHEDEFLSIERAK